MVNDIWFTAREKFGPGDGTELTWQNHTAWSKLTHLQELVSLDGMLNGLVFTPDSEEDWNCIVTEGHYVTQFFTSFEYVLQRVGNIEQYNLLAVIWEPMCRKKNPSTNFNFLGYDLIETHGYVSALTSCGGFDETFLPGDLNQFGLITSWEKAKSIQKELALNNPEENHADCFLYEVWRHKTIGRS